MSAHFTTPTDELLLLAETLGEVKTKTDKLEAEFATQARPLEAATNALSAALSGIKALQFHVLDNNLGQLSARVEEMRKAVDEQVGVIALELKKADETNAAKAGQEAEALRSEIAALQAQLGTLGAQFAAQLERVEFSAKEEAKKLQLIPGPAGAAGASLNPRGTFVDGETYNRLDVVSWLGSSYIAAVDGVTEKPSKNSNQWQVLASRGNGGGGGVPDINAILPSQSGNNGKLLTTNGSAASWSSTLTSELAISATTPSTTTSSGALVVSGGVGVAKTINVAEGITIGTSSIYGVNVKLNSQSGEEKTFLFQSVGVNRWGFGVEASLEFGSNSGSDFHLVSYSDAGIIIDVPIRLVRSAGGAFTLSRPAVFSSSTASTSIATGALKITGGLGVGGAVNAGTFYGLVDGVTAPATESGYARIYVDSADGDLKVKFGDGTVKTLATDT
jgi:hypothetical protein